MLEKFLKTVETQKLTPKEQKDIVGGNYPAEICGETPTGKPVKC
jgi:hypothetical protein